MTTYRIGRVYDEPGPDDGYRVLVDRLWPRGVSKEDADWDEWCKDVAPSTELRKWFSHKPERFAEFTDRYRQELHESGALAALRPRLAEHSTVTLLTATKDTDDSQAAVLLKLLQHGS